MWVTTSRSTLAHLLSALRPSPPGAPLITHEEWVQVYIRNADSLSGCHFVVHQHDHPIAGTHYDLRLQCNPTSSISFAIMYGLPGDPNSRRLNRNATETRVHCLWNHLIETASHSTGSMLIWDTGVYEILPYDTKTVSESGMEEDTDTDRDNTDEKVPVVTEQNKLRQALHRRKIKLRLHGQRLPHRYTLALRLTKDNNRHEQPKKPTRRRRTVHNERCLDQSSDSESNKSVNSPDNETAVAVASDTEDEVIRASNAYIGATNDVGSIHQRRWYLSIDRKLSGFEKQTTKSESGFTTTIWNRKSVTEVDPGSSPGFEPFVVGGRDSERSVVTGRLASEILSDEGVVGYIPRGLWKPITI